MVLRALVAAVVGCLPVFVVGIVLGVAVRDAPRLALIVVLLAWVVIAGSYADRCIPVLTRWVHRP